MRTDNRSTTSRASWSARRRRPPCPSTSGTIPEGKKYHSAYFDVYPGVWHHGDYIVVNDRGGVTMYGRSDTTLNPGGVRIGTAEIYRQVEMLEEVEDSLVVGQSWNNDVRVMLFVKLAAGCELTDELKNKIQTDHPHQRFPAPRAGQDHRRAGHPLHPEHEKGGTGRQKDHRGSGGAQQRCPEKSRESGFLCKY